MSHNRIPDWNRYWAAYKDLNVLERKSQDLDLTLRDLETEFECKFLSGDHLLIVSALEARIAELQAVEKTGIQSELF